MWLFLVFLGVPIIEIALFIQVGGVIGLWPTLAIVVATAVIGSLLMRLQGLAALADLRGSLSEMRDPTAPLAHGAMILFAGALLLTPGFFTDTIGLLLLVPSVRNWVIRYVSARITVQGFTMGGMPPNRDNGPSARDANVIDGEYHEIPRDRFQPGNDTRH